MFSSQIYIYFEHYKNVMFVTAFIDDNDTTY